MAKEKLKKVIKGLQKASKTHANMAASKYCKDPNYAKKSKRAKKAKGGPVIRGQGIVMKERLR